MSELRRRLRRARRRILFYILALLPREMHHSLLRRLVAHAPVRLPGGITFKLAENQDEIEQAFRLLHDTYVETGFAARQNSGLRVTLHSALPCTSILIAKRGDKVLGTVSLVQDNPVGFPLEHAFAIPGMRDGGRRLAEVSGLCIAKTERRDTGGTLLLHLLAFMYQYSMHCLGIDRLLIATLPKDACWYEAIFGFRPIPGALTLDYLGAPAAGSYLDYDGVSTHFQKHMTKSFSELYLGPPPEHFQLPERRYHKAWDPVMTDELLSYFFIEKSDLLETLSPVDCAHIRSSYRSEPYSRVLGPGSDSPAVLSRREMRFPVTCSAWLHPRGRVRTWRAKIRDVSASGFRAVLEDPGHWPEPCMFRFEIEVGDQAIASGTAQVVWFAQGVLGCKVASRNPIWAELIRYLETDLRRVSTKDS